MLRIHIVDLSLRKMEVKIISGYVSIHNGNQAAKNKLYNINGYPNRELTVENTIEGHITMWGHITISVVFL